MCCNADDMADVKTMGQNMGFVWDVTHAEQPDANVCGTKKDDTGDDRQMVSLCQCSCHMGEGGLPVPSQTQVGIRSMVLHHPFWCHTHWHQVVLHVSYPNMPHVLFHCFTIYYVICMAIHLPLSTEPMVPSVRSIKLVSITFSTDLIKPCCL